MRSLVDSNGLNCERMVCKSAEMAKYINDSAEMLLFLEKFFDKIIDEIERIDIYYTRFNSLKIPQITIYGKENPKRIKPVEFVRKIAGVYPHICAWRYLSCFADTEKTFYLDNFESNQTPAWDSLSKIPNLKVLYKGYSCNCLLSSADLFIRLTVLLLKKFNERFNWRGIKELHSPYSWSEKTSTNTLGEQTFILKNMTPYSRKSIDLSTLINHPIVFIPQESPGGWKAKEEQLLFENMPIYSKLLNFLFYINGSFKYFNSEDVKLVQKGDYILIMGDRGQQMCDYLTAGGVPLIELTLEDVDDKLNEFVKK